MVIIISNKLNPTSSVLCDKYEIDVDYKINTVRIEIKSAGVMYSRVINDILRFHYNIRSAKHLCHVINVSLGNDNIIIEKGIDKLIMTLNLPNGLYCKVSKLDIPIDKN